MAAADALDRRLEDLRNTMRTASWRVATLARSGSLYDCLWRRIDRASPTFFSPQIEARLNQLKAAGLTKGQVDSVEQSLDTKGHVVAAWQSKRDLALSLVVQRMVSRYVTAALLARRYALEGFDLTRARWRLPLVAREVGPETMTQILRNVCDPTASEATGPDCRHVEYLVGAFD
jgi:hypothetical protein